MRPDRFETLLHGLLWKEPQLNDVQPARDAGITRHPYGLVVTYPTGQRVLLQIVVTSADGDKFDQPEQIIEGDTPPAEVPVPALHEGGPLLLERVDKHLAAVVLNSGSREVVSAEAFSARDKPGAIPYGVKVTFHDTSRIYVYVVHAIPPGRNEWPSPKQAFQVPATV